jgi:drug/metabolite transporter (DMT)-like permease
MNWALVLILVVVGLGVTGELLFKTGSITIKNSDFSTVQDAASAVLALLRNPVILVGFACYAIASVLWIIVLSRLDLSYAYPIYALMYAFVPIAAMFFLGEQVPVGRWVGIGLIVAGVITVFRLGGPGM